MKKHIAIAFTLLALVLTGAGSHASGNTVPAGLAACPAGNDWDGDGVPNDDDVTPDDSCSATSTGVEDCTTGAGDGNPDCDSTGL